MEIESFSDDELPPEGSEKKSHDDVFNLNISIAVLESETEEIDGEFRDAQVEIVGEKSFPCPSCDKICKSKGGLTRHTNAKHCDTSGELPTESDMTIDNLTGIIQNIKTVLLSDDLYGTEINEFIKNASCSKALFDAVLPLYRKFCHKKNQDKLLEAFYGLMDNASTYLNCSNANASCIIMIEIPDHLVGHYKVCRERLLN